MLKEHYHSSSRFAWLTPLSGHPGNNGPWLIVEENTAAYDEQHTEACRKVTRSCLLQMLSDVLDNHTKAHNKATRACWESACGRISVNRNRSEADDSRLFVQRPEDYFLRIELHLDGHLLVAFQEPVWQHLQSGNTSMSNHLTLPVACLDALEAGALALQSAPLAGRRQSIASAA